MKNEYIVTSTAILFHTVTNKMDSIAYKNWEKKCLGMLLQKL